MIRHVGADLGSSMLTPHGWITGEDVSILATLDTIWYSRAHV
jgi:hypothetical protein